ncbi:hypothetical protein ACETK8_12300 [Brevundimonas staleyi]|uniref:Energy transducer TonB n=1 Tax=Brevundimonas staleyi TaxID=74326 RepID=A0ABW0FTY1_9CAUL
MTGATAAIEGRRRVAIGAGVAALHVGVLLWLGLSVVPVLPEVTTRAIDVVMMRPALGPAPMTESPVTGGGAASAPSTVHRPPEPRVEAVELTAPVETAAVQPLVLGVAPLVGPSNSSGAGSGSGDGIGSGTGPGAGGGGAAAVLIAGPVGAAITRDVNSLSLVRADRSHVVMRCRIRLNQRLDGCRVIGGHPRPSGYRETALLRVQEFRFRPAMRAGRPVDGRPVVVALAFPPPDIEPATAPVDAN